MGGKGRREKEEGRERGTEGWREGRGRGGKGRGRKGRARKGEGKEKEGRKEVKNEGRERKRKGEREPLVLATTTKKTVDE